MEILKQYMSFQNLKQGIRRVRLADDVYVECIKVFNSHICKIFVTPEVPKMLEEVIIPVLIVIISSEDETQAIAWDILNDKQVYVKKDLVDLKKEILRLGFAEPTELVYESRWEENLPNSEVYQIIDQDGNIPDTFIGIPWIIIDNKNWNTIAPYNDDLATWNFDAVFESEGDSTGNMGVYFILTPDALYSIADDWEVGDYITFNTEKGSEVITNISKHGSGALNTSKFFCDLLGAITETWTITFIEPPLGYGSNVLNVHISGAAVGNVYDSPGGTLVHKAYVDNDIGINFVPHTRTKSYFKYIELPEYTEKVSAYFFTKDESCKESLWKTFFEATTGHLWPVVLPEFPDIDTEVTREAIFYNPLFGPDFTDDIPFSAQMKAATINIYDSFIQGDWSKPGLLENAYGVIDEEYSFSCNRINTWSTIGVGDSYTPIDEEDQTEIKAAIVFDAYCVNPYVGGSLPFQFGINIQYKLYNDLSTLDQAVLDLVNLERTNRGLKELIKNPNLQKSAIKHAKDMIANDFFSHVGSDGSTFYDRAEEAGYFINISRYFCYVGENNARAYMDQHSADDVVQAWMNSPGHRAAILAEYHAEAGLVSYVNEDNETFFCLTFGKKPGAWAGFGSFDTTKLEKYINENFTFDPDMPSDFLKVYATQKKNFNDRDL